MYSFRDIHSIGRWVLKGPALLDREGNIFDKVYGSVVLAREVGSSVTLFVRDDVCILREATWLRDIDIRSFRSREFEHLTIRVEYFQLVRTSEELIPIVADTKERIEHALDSPSSGTQQANCLGTEYFQFHRRNFRTSRDSWIVAVDPESTAPWHAAVDLFSGLDRSRAWAFKEGFVMEPFNDLVLLESGDLNALPSHLFKLEPFDE